MHRRNLKFRLALVVPFLIITISAHAYKVTDLAATYANGQVFLTWKNPNTSNLEYRIYRSLEKIKNTSDLKAANFLGYVRDNSAKDERKSKLLKDDYYFTIPEKGLLSSTKGLYVVTCDDNKRHYYAVMVVNLSSDTEEKVINLGENSLDEGFKEHKDDPQPVLQAVVNQTNGDVHYEYVIWGNNQDVPHYPAFNNCGSFGYNFTLVERNPGSSGPLFVKFQDDDPFEKVSSGECSDCNILLLDDWLPNGENSYWVGYNVNYDTYSSNNPSQTKGYIRTYTQFRVHEIIDWCQAQPGIDPTRIYTSGFSHNGYGTMLNAMLYPEDVAAMQENGTPILIKAVNGSFREGQWCDNLLNLNSDQVDPETGDTIGIWDLLDHRTQLRLNYSNSLPFMSGVNGKQDVTVGWIGKYHWYDSVDASRHGGLWFWDQRDHGGSGKDFTSEETALDFLRFSTDKSYPAFSYCSINQDPGNGNAGDGDKYGAINGYLDWENNSIDDEKCDYSIDCFIKDFYVDGDLQKKYDSCTTDITFRRLQKFQPVNGQKINWKVKKGSVVKQQGSFNYNGNPITLKGVKIYKSGSTISLSINDCLREDGTGPVTENAITLVRSQNGYEVSVGMATSMTVEVEVNVIDMMGRVVSRHELSLEQGINTFPIALPAPGSYILQLKSDGFYETMKLVF